MSQGATNPTFAAIDAELRARLAAGQLGGEDRLQRELVLQPPAELVVYSLLILHEWDVHPSWSQFGKGDLVFTDGTGRFLVVETKAFDCHWSGKTAKKRRNRHRGLVREQAYKYAHVIVRRFPEAKSVVAAIFTDDPVAPGLVLLGECRQAT